MYGKGEGITKASRLSMSSTRSPKAAPRRLDVMASAEQIKALLKSHAEGDDDQFYSVAMQVAAHEAKLGHGKLAQELRALVDHGKATRELHPSRAAGSLVADLGNILHSSYPKNRMADMILSHGLESQIRRIIREQRSAGKILENGLSLRRKLLLVGPPGTGKTLTSSVLAGELGLPLLQIRLDGLITKFMGETAAKLRQIFEATHRSRGVYLFDEFDAIGSHRGLTNDVGEIRRVLNSFLVMIEQDNSRSIIVAATNHAGILDRALFRRFDDVLEYELPEAWQIAELLRIRLGRRAVEGTEWVRLAEASIGLSYAEVSKAANEVLKSALIDDQREVDESAVGSALSERKEIADRLNAYIA